MRFPTLALPDAATFAMSAAERRMHAAGAEAIVPGGQPVPAAPSSARRSPSLLPL